METTTPVPGLRRLAGEFSGAFADLGTFLPLVIAVLAVGGFDPVGLFWGFGLFALAVAAIYRRPVPVQPMKAVAALMLAGGLSAAGASASGLLIGISLLAFAASGLIERAAQLVSGRVLGGVQVGLGLLLAQAGLMLMVDNSWVGFLAFGLLLAGMFLGANALAGVAVLLLALVMGAMGAKDALPPLPGGWYWPMPHLPAAVDLWEGLGTAVIPQLALTLTNAVIVTAAIAAKYFPQDRDRISPRRLAVSSGTLNLLLAPFGAFPMCHGAGGLVAQYRFGARGWLAPAIFGVSCIVLGAALGPAVLPWLKLAPMGVFGAMLAIAGTQLAYYGRPREFTPGTLAVTLATAITCVLVNVAAGLVVGLAVDYLFRFARAGEPGREH